jgi:hypothetical protein
MIYEVTGKIKVDNYEYLLAGVKYCKKNNIPNMRIGDICSCGQGYIVREKDFSYYKDFVCIHCGKRDSVSEDPQGIF